MLQCRGSQRSSVTALEEQSTEVQAPVEVHLPSELPVKAVLSVYLQRTSEIPLVSNLWQVNKSG